MSEQETKDRVDRALEFVQMAQFAARRPNQLSGGRQQRVALARALIVTRRSSHVPGPTGENQPPATVERTVYMGSVLQVILRLASGPDDPGVDPEDGRR